MNGKEILILSLLGATGIAGYFLYKRYYKPTPTPTPTPTGKPELGINVKVS